MNVAWHDSNLGASRSTWSDDTGAVRADQAAMAAIKRPLHLKGFSAEKLLLLEIETFLKETFGQYHHTHHFQLFKLSK